MTLAVVTLAVMTVAGAVLYDASVLLVFCNALPLLSCGSPRLLCLNIASIGATSGDRFSPSRHQWCVHVLTLRTGRFAGIYLRPCRPAKRFHRGHQGSPVAPIPDATRRAMPKPVDRRRSILQARSVWRPRPIHAQSFRWCRATTAPVSSRHCWQESVRGGVLPEAHPQEQEAEPGTFGAVSHCYFPC
jgi:hypothetical protein